MLACVRVRLVAASVTREETIRLLALDGIHLADLKNAFGDWRLIGGAMPSEASPVAFRYIEELQTRMQTPMEIMEAINTHFHLDAVWYIAARKFIQL